MLTHPQYVVRFVGRFVVATEGQPSTPSRLTVMAMNMSHNPDLRAHPHDYLMTAPRVYAHALGTTAPEFSVFSPTVTADADAQLVSWRLGGCCAHLEDAGSAMRFESWTMLPDLAALSDSSADPRHVNGELPEHGPVSGRFTFTSGSITSILFDEKKRVSFEPLEQQEPMLPAQNPLPDAIDVALVVADRAPLIVTWTDNSGPRTHSVSFARSRSDEPVVITVTNLCPRGGTDDDVEFAAYYDVLIRPPRVRQRRIPYVPRLRTQNAKADCSGIALVQL